MELDSLGPDERAMFQDLLVHFVNALNVERRLTADLTRQLETLRERIQLLEAAAYGLF
jgi:hypothetical protein